MTGVKIVNVTPEMVAAAHDCDLKFRGKGHWQRVPDEQVARLLSGAYELIAAQATAAERELWRDHPALADIPKMADSTDAGDWAEYAGGLYARLLVLRTDLLDGTP